MESKKKRYFAYLSLLLILIVFPRPTWADDFSPMGVVRNGTDRVLTILRESRNGKAPPLRRREGDVLKVVSTYFDFDAMAKSSLGPTWNQLAPAKRQEFAKLFKQLLFNTYVDRMEHYHNQPVSYVSQKVNGDLAVVRTDFLSQDEKIPINYLMRKEGGHWKAYDVVVQGVSYDDNYRAQIQSILSSQSFDSLLTLLRQKVERPG